MNTEKLGERIRTIAAILDGAGKEEAMIWLNQAQMTKLQHALSNPELKQKLGDIHHGHIYRKHPIRVCSPSGTSDWD